MWEYAGYWCVMLYKHGIHQRCKRLSSATEEVYSVTGTDKKSWTCGQATTFYNARR
jgi:hypothetical protein